MVDANDQMDNRYCFTCDLIYESPYSPSRIGGLNISCDNLFFIFVCNKPRVGGANDLMILILDDLGTLVGWVKIEDFVLYAHFFSAWSHASNHSGFPNITSLIPSHVQFEASPAVVFSIVKPSSTKAASNTNV